MVVISAMAIPGLKLRTDNESLSKAGGKFGDRVLGSRDSFLSTSWFFGVREELRNGQVAIYPLNPCRSMHEDKKIVPTCDEDLVAN